MQSLQIGKVGYVISFFLSLVSLLYGGGSLPALLFHEEKNSFLNTISRLIMNLIDTSLRCLFMAYMLTIVKEFALAILLAYFCLVALSICIYKRETIIRSDEFLATLQSFPCSPYEMSNVSSCLRSRSKVTFGFLFVTSMTLVSVITNTEYLESFDYSLKNSSSLDVEYFTSMYVTNNCEDVCMSKSHEEIRVPFYNETLHSELDFPQNFEATEDFVSYICNDRWRYLSQIYHMEIQIILWSLFGFSFLEWVVMS